MSVRRATIAQTINRARTEVLICAFHSSSVRLGIWIPSGGAIARKCSLLSLGIETYSQGRTPIVSGWDHGVVSNRITKLGQPTWVNARRGSSCCSCVVVSLIVDRLFLTLANSYIADLTTTAGARIIYRRSWSDRQSVS